MPIPQSVFCADAIPARERFAVWSESVSPLFRPHLAENVRAEDFTGQTQAFMLGNTLLGLTSLVGVGGFRALGSGPLNDRNELFLVQLYLKGGFKGHNGVQPLEVTPGDIVILDSTRPLATQVVDSELLSLVIPRQALLAALGPGADLHPRVISGRSAPGLILANAFLSAWQALPQASADDAQAVDRLLLGAVAGLLGKPGRDPLSAAGTATVEHATLDAIRAYIERHLANPRLGPEQLCQRFGCARATLYRLFAPVGGVASYIRRARLERSHGELMAAPPNTTVTQVALRWGFGNFSNFCRLFRSTFGATPGEILEQGKVRRSERSGGPSPASPSRLLVPEYRHWIEGL